LKNSTTEFAEQFVAEIRRFNEIVVKEFPVDAKALQELGSTLSRLLDFGERCPDVWSKTEIEAPEIDRKKIADIIDKRFPDFEFYNSCIPENAPVDDARIEVNDACDDVYDIYHDLNESLWYFENGEPALFIWTAKTLFMHWGRHAINIKSYLHKKTHDW
jgi:uncharacterized protein DUF5063